MSQAVGRESAFPTAPINRGYPEGTNPNGTGVGDGISKRDYFAAMALQGFAANSLLIDASERQLAEMSVKQADELLSALYPYLKD